MTFKLIRQCFQKMASYHDAGDVDFYLEEDKWDDFGFSTLYHLHASKRLTGSKPEYLGPINIMKKGQTKEDIYLIRNLIGTQFNDIPNDFCSISMSVELYRGLDRLLKRGEERKRFAEALKMIFSEDDERYKEFHAEECFQTSLMRNATMKAYGLILGKEIMYDECSSYDLAEVPLTFRLPNNTGEVKLDFSSIDQKIATDLNLPSRLLACIGNNGAGKSTILYRLARILFATPSTRSLYADTLGSIVPSDAGFRRLFLISYSAFDNFILPGASLEDYNLILEGLKNKNGRLVYCGIRDVRKEYILLRNTELEKLGHNPEGENELIDIIDKDHINYHKLKTIEDLAEECVEAYCSIAEDYSKVKLWNRLMKECQAANDSFAEMEIHTPIFIYRNNLSQDKFKHLSTGIKYLLHSLTSILDRIETNSIIIFDEPENHIQPPLLCKFLHCLRIISEEYKSLVLVATHSPVILQETLAKNVIIVERFDEDMTFRKPSIETYGENIGNITDEVFNLNTSVTSYQKSAKKIVAKYHPSPDKYSDPLDYLEDIKSKIGVDFGNEIQAFLISEFLKATNYVELTNS